MILREDTKYRNAFSKTTTGMSYYDRFLNSKELKYMEKSRGCTGKYRYYLPHQYISSVARMFKKSITDYYRYLDSPHERKIVDHLKDLIKSGKKLDMPMLNYSTYNGPGQEGLHRAKAAEELDIELIPVLVIKDVGETI